MSTTKRVLLSGMRCDERWHGDGDLDDNPCGRSARFMYTRHVPRVMLSFQLSSFKLLLDTIHRSKLNSLSRIHKRSTNSQIFCSNLIVFNADAVGRQG